MVLKKPSADIGMSLLSQRVGAPGRAAETISTSPAGMSKISMTVPGDADVHAAPGRVHDRCVCKYVAPMARFGGKDTIGFP